MDIKESNILIAKFMCVRETKSSYESYGSIVPIWYTRPHKLYRTTAYHMPDKSFDDFIEHAQYHKCWKWLMPVVEEIEILKIGDHKVTVKIEGTDCSIKIGNRTPFGTLGGKSKIENTYNTIVQFLDWYNTKLK